VPAYAPTLIDDFNRANQAGLGSASVGGVGTGRTWTDKVATGDNGMSIVSNTARPTNNTDGSACLDLACNQSLIVEVTLAKAPAANNDELDIGFRTSGYGTASPKYFRVGAQKDAGGVHRIHTVGFGVGANPTLISGSETTGITWADGDRLGVVCIELPSSAGTLITVLKNGVAMASYLDTNAGRAVGDRVNLSCAGSGATPAQFEDLQVTNLGAPPYGTARYGMEKTTVAPDISPSGTLAYAWGQTANLTRKRLIRRANKLGTTLAAETHAPVSTNPSDCLAVQYISPPLSAQVIHGHVKGMIRVLESAASVNAAAQCIVYVCSSDGTTLRKLLVGGQTKGNSSGASPEWATALTSRKFPQAWVAPGTPLIPYVCVDGDRIVVEIGFGKASTSTVAQTFDLGSSAASDLSETEGTTANNPWFEFLAGLELLGVTITTATETDAAQTISKTKRVTITPATTTDAAQTVARQLGTTKAITPATETDAAQATVKTKQHAAPVASETDAAQAARAQHLRSITSSSETSSAVALTHTKRLAVGAATETDAAQAVAKTKQKTLTPATSSSAAQTLRATRSKTLAACLETDAAQAIVSTKRTVAAAAAEVGTAAPLPRTKRAPLIAAGETGSASSLSHGRAFSITPATETDVAQAARAAHTRVLTPAQEVTSSQTLSAHKAVGAVLASETDAAVGLVSTKTIHKTIQPAAETDSAPDLAFTHAGIVIITAAVEVDSAQTLAYRKPIHKTIAPATTTDSAQTLSARKRRGIPTGSETDSAQTLSAKAKLVAATETDVARPLSFTKPLHVGIPAAGELSTAVAPAAAKRVTLPASTTVDKAVSFITQTEKSIQPALELDAAAPMVTPTSIAIDATAGGVTLTATTRGQLRIRARSGKLTTAATESDVSTRARDSGLRVRSTDRQ
jgi:hypothetical protein